MTKHFGQDVPTERLQIVVTTAWMERIDEWRRKQTRIPSRSDAVRILVTRYLDQTLGKMDDPGAEAYPEGPLSV